MYRQIWVDPEDQPYQSILWRDDSSQSVQTHQLTTVTYGLACSAFLASRVLRQLADDHAKELPLGAATLKHEIYMDDVLSGAHSIDEALSKRCEIIQLAKAGGFSVRKWSSNHPQLLADLPSELLAADTLSLQASQSVISVLGLTWNPEGDFFNFSIAVDSDSENLTKRSVLSKLARLFDPLGWLSPALVGGKILMQSLWLLKVDWDTKLPDDIIFKWNHWYNQLCFISDIKIPRWSHFTPDATSIELHGFADASKHACAAVIYLKITQGSNISVTLQSAKTKVAPIKTLSIPRLELCAAQILAKLTHHFVAHSRINFTAIHLWSDSHDTLHWLHDHPSRWQVFVAHRCAEIHTLLPQATWHYVKTSQNPADLNSRGVEPSKLKDQKLWWRGPEFLHDPLYVYPQFNNQKTVSHNTIVELSVRPQPKNSVIKRLWDLNTRYSNLDKLLRITSYFLRLVFKLIRKIRSKNKSKLPTINFDKLKFIELDYSTLTSPEVSAEELNNARLVWVYLHQQVHFSDEIEKLKQKRPINTSSSLIKLNPFLDKELLRVGGRLSHSLLDYNSKHPLILESNTHLTKLIVSKAHDRVLHGGTQLTLSQLRQEYWVLKGRQVVRSVISKCFSCRKEKQKASSQLMSELPCARVLPSPPFQKSGVDYAGPFNIRLSKSRGKGTLKGYISLFICMSTKAVHLEVVEDYSSASFLAAFHRFVSRRGHCAELYSDCGTNFVGADKDLQELFQQASFQKSVFSNLAQLRTKWYFNPPSAPHFGGLWEAAVKSTKYHLKRVIGDQILTFVEFSTLLCRIEACLNSRPLVPLSDEPMDLEPLTPSHFLLQRSSCLVPEPDAENITTYHGRWKLITSALQHFWSRWSAEYLNTLQARNKWHKVKRSHQIGDLVLVRNELTPPGQWPLGRIIETFPSKDGLVRKVVVKTATSTLKRPIVKLVLMATNEELAAEKPSIRPDQSDEGGRNVSNSRALTTSQ